MITEKLRDYIPPRYSWPLLAGALLTNMAVYNGARFINRSRTHYILSLPLDDRIPLCTPFVVIYLLAFVQWAAGYVLAARESREVCHDIAVGDIFAKLICFVIFLMVPTTLIRPEVIGSSIFDRLTRLVYSLDAPDNLLPSIHCLESWMCLRGSLMIKEAPSWYRPASFIFTILVCASTVFMKQHLLPDIPTGILAAEIGLWLARRLPGKESRVYPRTKLTDG